MSKAFVEYLKTSQMFRRFMILALNCGAAIDLTVSHSRNTYTEHQLVCLYIPYVEAVVLNYTVAVL